MKSAPARLGLGGHTNRHRGYPDLLLEGIRAALKTLAGAARFRKRTAPRQVHPLPRRDYKQLPRGDDHLNTRAVRRFRVCLVVAARVVALRAPRSADAR